MDEKDQKVSEDANPKFDKHRGRISTIKDVAQLAAVSVATVSRVVNNPQSVGVKLRRRVLSAMQELEYRPNLFASSLAKRRSKSIGLVTTSVGPFFTPLVMEVERAVRTEGNCLVVATRKCHGDDMFYAVKFLRERRCDSIILFPGTASDDRVEAMMDEDPRLVLIHRLIPKHASRCVLVDNRAGTRMATRYLINCGHRDIAVIRGKRGNTECDERFEGFVQTMREAGLSLNPKLMAHGDFSFAGGERAVAQLMASGKRFSALFCFNDEMASGAMSYLRSIGMKLPDDLSIIGFDDQMFTDQLFPSLTTIHQPLEEIGRIAAQHALALSNYQDLPSGASVLQPRLVIRGSVVPYLSPVKPVLKSA